MIATTKTRKKYPVGPRVCGARELWEVLGDRSKNNKSPPLSRSTSDCELKKKLLWLLQAASRSSELSARSSPTFYLLHHQACSVPVIHSNSHHRRHSPAGRQPGSQPPCGGGGWAAARMQALQLQEALQMPYRTVLAATRCSTAEEQHICRGRAGPRL